MKQLFLLILLGGILGSASCTSKSFSTPVFSELDSLLENYPDSALTLIQGINVDTLSNPEQAEYALLMVKAMDKNYISFRDDSLIMVSVNYYKNKPHNSEEQAKAYYYLARVYEDLGDDIAAAEAYLTALDIMEKRGISKLRFNANINLANCYYYQDLYDRAMERYRTAYHVAVELGTPSDLFLPLRNMGNIYFVQNKPDSALTYYQQSLAIAQHANDSVFCAMALRDIAHLYTVEGNYTDANRYMSQAIDLSLQTDYSYYYMKGEIMLNLNQHDSARYYLQKSMNIDNLYTYVSTNYALYTLEKKAGNFENATQYADNYIIYYDSIQHQIQREEMALLMNDHALESHKREIDARQQRFMFYYIIGFLVFLSICVYIFFHIDRNKKKKLIGLQQQLMHNRSQLAQLQNRLTTEIEIGRQESEQVHQYLQMRQKELCMRLFEASSSYRFVQEFLSAKRQKKYPKDLSEKDRIKIQQSVNEIYIDFIQQHQNNFPQLSLGDMYCCVLAYMGFSNSLIGYLMGVDPNVVTQRRYRIKGKMDESAFNSIFSPISTNK